MAELTPDRPSVTVFIRVPVALHAEIAAAVALEPELDLSKWLRIAAREKLKRDKG